MKVTNFLRIFKKNIWIFLITLSFTINAAEVDTVVTYSRSMEKEIKAVVIQPQSNLKNKSFPVVYLLHGYSGNYSDWVKKVPTIKKYADLYNLIIVCPDGNYNSWYIDSDVKKNSNYETYISKELVSFIDKNYKTIPKREARAITGLSMGGHGAFYLAFRHQNVYANTGSMSGGLDLRPFKDNWELDELLGDLKNNPEKWEESSVTMLTHLLQPHHLNIIFECGVDDFFYDVNVTFHKKLLEKKIPHRFTSSPGSHTWEFWSNAIKYQLQFFKDCFKEFN